MMLVNTHRLKFFLLLLFLISMQHIKAQKWSIQDCIDTALVNNKNLQISRNNQRISEHKIKEVQANLIPKIGINGEYKYFMDLPYQLMPMTVFNGPEGQFKEIQFGVPHNISANLQFSMPLYNAELFQYISTAKIAKEMSDIQYKKSEEKVFFEVSNLYFNAQIIQSQLSFIDSNTQNTIALLKNLELLKSQLLAKETDVTKLKLQLQQLETQKIILVNKQKQVLNGLKIIIGLPIERNITIEEEIIFETKLSQDLNNNIDLQLANYKFKLIESEFKAIRKSRLPNLSLFGAYGTTGFGFDDQNSSFLNFYPMSFVGLRLQYPLFNGTVTKRKMNQKELELNNADLQLSLLIEHTSMLTENAINEKSTSEQTVKNTREQVELANHIYQQTILQQKQGTANLTDVLMADHEVREAQQQYILSIITYLKADLELKKLNGSFSIKKQ